LNKRILKLAIPNIIANITVPLLGMVDLAIVGRTGGEQLIGAIAISTTIFNLIYWNFGFLRMGTSGFTAQAYGANDMKESMAILTRGLVIALSLSLLIILFQSPIAYLSEKFINTSPEIMQSALVYFFIRIWAAPATLGLYIIKGWFIGMQNSHIPMIVSILLNIINIFFSIFLAVYLKMGIAGVAWGTVIAQYSGLIIGIIFWFIKFSNLKVHINLKESLHWSKLKLFFKVNIDIFLRTLCLSIVFAFIPFISASLGDRILAVNTLLMQLFTIFSYILDGFAYAGEALTGRYIGAKDSKLLKLSTKYLLIYGFILTFVFTIAYLFWGKNILFLFTKDIEIIKSSEDFLKWIVLVPICGMAAFIFDGIYIGAIASKTMRNVMFVATASFFISYYSLINFLGNDAIWIAFLIFLAFRGGLMWIMYPKKILVESTEIN
jgi:MATE family multidrug resistance protein